VASALIAVGRAGAGRMTASPAYGREPEATDAPADRAAGVGHPRADREAEDQHTLELASALERAWREERGGAAADAEASLAWRREVMRARPARWPSARRTA